MTLRFPDVAVSSIAISLQSAEHVSNLFSLQVDSKKATEHLQNWHAAPEQATSSHVPTENAASPSMSTNIQPVIDKGRISKTGCTFVDRESCFLCLGT